MKKAIIIFLMLAGSWGYASSGHGEHAGGPVEVPRVVLYQAINVLILFAGLFFFLKATIIKYYSDRRSQYLAAAEKSQSAREQAEKQFLDIKHKIDKLESSTDESLSRARAEATDMRQALAKEAQELAKKIKHEAEETAKIEIIKAQTHLKEQLLRDALDAAKKVLSKDIGSADHQRLQGEFVNKVKAVNS